MKKSNDMLSFFSKNGLFASFLIVSAMLLQISRAEAQTAADNLKLVEGEQYGKALRAFSAAITSAPNDAKQYYYRGYTYVKADKPDSAIIDFEKGISVSEKEPLNYVGKGYYLLNQGKVQEAQAAFDQALQKSKNKNVEVLNAVAEAYLTASTKDIVRALAILEKSKTIDKGNPQTYLLFGDAYILQNNGGLSVSNYEKAAELNKGLARAPMSIGKVYTRARNYTEAIKAFQNAVAIDPNYAPVYKEMGELYYQTNQIDKAKDAYKKYIELSALRESSRDRYAAFLFLAKEYEQAIVEINEVLKKEPNHMIMNRLLAYSSYELNDYNTGVQAIQKFFQVAKPEKIIASDYEYRGKLFLKANTDSLGIQNGDSLAILDINKSIDMDSTKIDNRGIIADAYKKDKRYGDAAKVYEQIITEKNATSTNKANANDFFALGVAYYFDKQFVKADTAFTHVTQLASTSHQGYLWQARARVGQDPDSEKGLAKQSFDKVIELIEANPEKDKYKKDLIDGYSYLGYHYVIKNNATQALDAWQKVLALDPGNKKAIAAIDAIKNPKGSQSKSPTKAQTAKKK